MNEFILLNTRVALCVLPLLIIAGCATTQRPEPTLHKSEKQIEQPQVKQEAEPEAAKSVETPQAITQVEPEPVPLETRTSPATKHIVAKAVGPKPGDTVPETLRADVVTVEGRSGWEKLAEFNDRKLVNVYKGLDKATALLIMQSSHNPAKREKITGANGRIYDVYFYLTRAPKKGKPVTEKLCTPVIFSNNEVVAIGKFNLKKLRTTGIAERKKRRSS
jgi:hypothetical protein